MSEQEDDELLEALQAPGWRRYLSGPAAVALVCAALPFGLTLDLNGLRPISLIAGGVGALAAFVGFALAARSRNWGAAAVNALLLLVCVGHVLTGGVVNLGFDADAAARALVAEQGIAIESWTPPGDEGDNDYSFTGTRDGTFCMGFASVTPNSSNHSVSCGLPFPPAQQEARCADGDADACFNASRRYASDADAPDAAAMQRFEQRACELGSKSGCLNAGLHLRDAAGSESSAALGGTMWARGCELGDARCCAYGELLRAGTGVAQDQARAVSFFRRGCDGGAAVGCVNLGSALRLGRGVEMDLPASAASYHRACELHDAVGCLNEQENQLLGRGVPIATEPALTQLRAACSEGNAGVCGFIGVTLHEGTAELPMDRAAAFGFMQSACEGGNSDGCHNVGVYQRGGLGGQPRDPAAARASFQRACELGHQGACELVAAAR
ncbi:MAG: sel1 repeat family protein [Sandaracinaceae bacterium]|nr:sel1 repeat family protein [Sandaracinaceae bacterium]